MDLKQAKTTYQIDGWLYDDPQQGEQLRLHVDGVELSLAESLRVRSHSPSGFNIGYLSSGPAQTALAICLHLFESRAVAEHLYQRFKETFVARWQPQMHPFTVTIDVADFLIDNRDLLALGHDWDALQDEITGDNLLGEALGLLSGNEREEDQAPDEPTSTSQSASRRTDTIVQSQYQVGDVVRISPIYPDRAAGAQAFVYEAYDGGGVSLITEQGDDLSGFDLDDQDALLTFLYASDLAYQFRSVSWLQADWQKGVFAAVFRSVDS